MVPNTRLLIQRSYRFWAFLITTYKTDTFHQNLFFHDWAPYGRRGPHRTVKIRVVAMRVFFIVVTFQETGTNRFSGRWMFS